MLASNVKSDRLTQLRLLLEDLAEAIDRRPGARDLAQLAKQYRDTLREIEELEQSESVDDDIGAILASKRAAWKRSGTD